VPGRLLQPDLERLRQSRQAEFSQRVSQVLIHAFFLSQKQVNTWGGVSPFRLAVASACTRG
jgi:hypothetical protein